MMKRSTGDEVEGIKDLLAFYPDKAGVSIS